jgi:hypothetical protein
MVKRISRMDGTVVEVPDEELPDRTGEAEPPDYVPRTRFLRAAVAAGLLTRAEALTANRARTLPAAWETIVAGLSAAEAFRLRMLWCEEILRIRSPLWPVLIQGGAFTPAQLRQAFHAAADAQD